MTVLRIIFAGFAFLAAAACAGEPGKPPVPGVINPSVTQQNIHSNICRRDWTKSVRPPVSYTNRVKRLLMVRSGIPSSQIHLYELDHLVPLEIGGNPTDPSNLWLQPWNGPLGAHAKDRIENEVRREVCSGQMTLKQGQAVFLTGEWMRMLE